MISSKGIKILCYIIVGFSILISAILVLFGIQQATDKNQISIVLIILGVLIPLFTSISLYPIFALANIDENLHLLTNKVSSIEAKIHSNSNAEKEELTKKFKEETSDIEIIKSKTNTYKPKEKTNPQEKPSSLSNDTTNFINAKYNLNITSPRCHFCSEPG